MIAPLHPETVVAINTLIAPAFQVVVAFSFLVMIGVWGYRLGLWIKDRKEDRELSEIKQKWVRQ